LVAAATVTLAGCGTAASDESGEGGRAEEISTVPAGTVLVFSLDERVSTQTHAPGDEFSATLMSDVTDSEGAAVLLEGSPSRWVVTQASEGDDQSVLAVELGAVRLGGSWVPLVAEVVSADLDVDERDSDGETAAKIGIGAAAGAILGQVVGGDAGSTLVGAGVGTAVGAVVALSTRDGSATLPAGSSITVRLKEPLVTS
jgi:hypothetical protein